MSSDRTEAQARQRGRLRPRETFAGRWSVPRDQPVTFMGHLLSSVVAGCRTQFLLSSAHDETSPSGVSETRSHGASFTSAGV